MLDKLFKSTMPDADIRPKFCIRATKETSKNKGSQTVMIQGVNEEEALLEYFNNYPGASQFSVYEVDGEEYTAKQHISGDVGEYVIVWEIKRKVNK